MQTYTLQARPPIKIAPSVLSNFGIAVAAALAPALAVVLADILLVLSGRDRKVVDRERGSV